jgi:hypothetical protein
MQLFVNLTVPYDGSEFEKPWTVYLTQENWRKGETGEIVLRPMPAWPPEIDPEAYNPRVPQNSASPRDFAEITDDKDVSRILKCGRDNGWNMLLSVVSTWDGTNSLTLSYESPLTLSYVNWFWQRFSDLMGADSLVGFPVFARPGIEIKRSCKIEDHLIHILLTEQGVPTTETDGNPCMLFRAPRATFKFRCESLEFALRAITMCCNREPQLIEPHHGKAWALISSIDGGEIPQKHRIQLVGTHALEKVAEWNKETFIAGLASKPYGAGLGKLTAKFDSEEPYAATIAVEKGVHDERATAIYFEQGVHRCLLTRRVHEATGGEALWSAMKDWAEFQPKRSARRSDPGQLFYPAEYTHVFQKYWDVSNDPLQHPESSVETDRTKSWMQDMSRALSEFDVSNWDPQPSDVAPEKSQRVAHDGAVSRRYPIQDSVDYWPTPAEQVSEEESMIAAGKISGRAGGQDTDGPISQSGAMSSESSSALGSTGTCVASGNPLNT